MNLSIIFYIYLFRNFEDHLEGILILNNKVGALME
jgi:hypothetical protein